MIKPTNDQGHLGPFTVQKHRGAVDVGVGTHGAL